MDPKKPSLLTRLFIRNREGGHPLVMEPSEMGESTVNGHGTAAAVAEPPPIEMPERLSKKEETAIRIQEGFSDLSSLLKNIGSKLEVQNTRNVDLVEHVRPLPPLLNRLSDHLEAQRETSVALRDSIRGLETASQAQVDFLKKVETGHRQMVETFEKSQSRALNVFYKAQKETYEVFKKHQESQSRQFQDIMVKTHKSFTKLLVIFFVAILVAVSAAVVIGRAASTPAPTVSAPTGGSLEREPAPGDLTPR